MNSVNFNQLLCKQVAENGEDICGVFDTLLCERGKSRFFICVFFTQILEPKASYDRYYYRIILRYLGKKRSDMKSYRIDTGTFWEDIDDLNNLSSPGDYSHFSTTRPGYSGKLFIGYEFDFNVPGNYEVDLYVSKMNTNDTQELYEKLPVKELNLVSISPFQIFFQNS